MPDRLSSIIIAVVVLLLVRFMRRRFGAAADKFLDLDGTIDGARRAVRVLEALLVDADASDALTHYAVTQAVHTVQVKAKQAHDAVAIRKQDAPEWLTGAGALIERAEALLSAAVEGSRNGQG